MRKLLIALLMVWGFCAAGWAQVTFDVVSTYHTVAPGTSITGWNHVVTSGKTNNVVLLGVAFSGAITGVTVTINGASPDYTGSRSDWTCPSYLFGKSIGNTTGNIAITISWTNSVYAIAFSLSAYNVDQTTPFIHTTTNSGVGGPASTITITSATNNMTVQSMAADSGAIPTAPSKTSVAADHTSPGYVGIGISRAAGAAANIHTWATGSGWDDVGVDLLYVGDATTTTSTAAPTTTTTTSTSSTSSTAAPTTTTSTSTSTSTSSTAAPTTTSSSTTSTEAPTTTSTSSTTTSTAAPTTTTTSSTTSSTAAPTTTTSSTSSTTTSTTSTTSSTGAGTTTTIMHRLPLIGVG